MFRPVVAIIKIILWVPVVVSYLMHCTMWRVVIWNPIQRKKKFTQTVSFYARLVLWYSNIKLTTINQPARDQHYLLVGNHLGLIDVLLIAVAWPSLFITSVEMKNTPLLGTLCEMGGCLFVERRNRAKMKLEIGQIRKTLQEGFNVVLYPEGTSTNGERVIPFKKSLMTAAAGTGVPILPMVLNYTRVNGEPMSAKWRDYVFWYGDIPFIEALWKMMSLKELRAEIEFLQPIVCHSDEEKHAVAARAQAQIEEKYVKIPLAPGEASRFEVPKFGASHSKESLPTAQT